MVSWRAETSVEPWVCVLDFLLAVEKAALMASRWVDSKVERTADEKVFVWATCSITSREESLQCWEPQCKQLNMIQKTVDMTQKKYRDG